MTKEHLITAPEGTDLAKAEKILQEYKIEKLPVVSNDGKLIGLITYRDILQLSNFPNAVKDSYGQFAGWCRVGHYKRFIRQSICFAASGCRCDGIGQRARS